MKQLFLISGMLSVILVLGSGCSTAKQKPSAGVASRPAPPDIVSAPMAVQPEAPAPAAAPSYTPPVAVSSSEPSSAPEHLRIIEFKIKAPDATNAYLAGEFNEWSETALPMTKQADGEWTASIALKTGSYQYKFIVDGQWTPDPKNPEHTDDGYGGSNSVIQVPDAGGKP